MFGNIFGGTDVSRLLLLLLLLSSSSASSSSSWSPLDILYDPEMSPSFQDPVLPASHPALPDSHPVLPASHSALPASYPVLPASHPALPDSHPALPASHPVRPVSHHVLPASHPALTVQMNPSLPIEPLPAVTHLNPSVNHLNFPIPPEPPAGIPLTPGVDREGSDRGSDEGFERYRRQQGVVSDEDLNGGSDEGFERFRRQQEMGSDGGLDYDSDRGSDRVSEEGFERFKRQQDSDGGSDSGSEEGFETFKRQQGSEGCSQDVFVGIVLQAEKTMETLHDIKEPYTVTHLNSSWDEVSSTIPSAIDHTFLEICDLDQSCTRVLPMLPSAPHEPPKDPESLRTHITRNLEFVWGFLMAHQQVMLDQALYEDGLFMHEVNRVLKEIEVLAIFLSEAAVHCDALPDDGALRDLLPKMHTRTFKITRSMRGFGVFRQSLRWLQGVRDVFSVVALYGIPKAAEEVAAENVNRDTGFEAEDGLGTEEAGFDAQGSGFNTADSGFDTQDSGFDTQDSRFDTEVAEEAREELADAGGNTVGGRRRTGEVARDEQTEDLLNEGRRGRRRRERLAREEETHTHEPGTGTREGVNRRGRVTHENREERTGTQVYEGRGMRERDTGEGEKDTVDLAVSGRTLAPKGRRGRGRVAREEDELAMEDWANPIVPPSGNEEEVSQLASGDLTNPTTHSGVNGREESNNEEKREKRKRKRRKNKRRGRGSKRQGRNRHTD